MIMSKVWQQNSRIYSTVDEFKAKVQQMNNRPYVQNPYSPLAQEMMGRIKQLTSKNIIMQDPD